MTWKYHWRSQFTVHVLAPFAVLKTVSSFQCMTWPNQLIHLTDFPKSYLLKKHSSKFPTCQRSQTQKIKPCINSRLPRKQGKKKKNNLTLQQYFFPLNPTLHRFSLRHTQVRTYNSTMRGKEEILFLVGPPAGSSSACRMCKSVERSLTEALVRKKTRRHNNHM